jgi:high-affinity nickel-transport protein
MVLVDTTDGITMRLAYGWAFSRPIRKIYYNLTVTIISVLVAFVIGGLELLGVLAGELGLRGGVWNVLGGLNFGTLGVAVIALFVVTWGVSVAYYRYRRYDEIGFPTTGASPASGP